MNFTKFLEHVEFVYQTLRTARPTAVDPVNAMNTVRAHMARGKNIADQQRLALAAAEKFLRIFTVFQRLHGRTEYEGSGVGLAVCRKIAERHHGGITAKSAPGRGAAFVVTLPLKQMNVEVKQ